MKCGEDLPNKFICIFLAKGLTLYQVMAPNAYSCVGGYVSVLNKSVDAKNYEKVVFSHALMLLESTQKNIEY